MERITHAPSERSPEVDFDFPGRRLFMAGESYPEDAAQFFGPLIEGLRSFAAELDQDHLTFDLRLSYFNSSSAKALMNMFQLLEDAALAGNRITINWHYQADDDTMEEFGQDFSEDFQGIDFKMCVIDDED